MKIDIYRYLKINVLNKDLKGTYLKAKFNESITKVLEVKKIIRLEKIQDKFQFFYNNYLFLEHSQKNPALIIGIGKGKYKDRNGIYKISEKIKEKIPLRECKILEQTPKEIKIEFSHKDLIFTVKIIDNVNNYLEVIPNCSDPAINRFWLRLHAFHDEKIFGCGEQYSEFNLRGKDVPLWSEEQGTCRGDPKILTWLLNIGLGIGGSWYTTYFPQPTFVSSSNYFFHAETTKYAKFNFKNKNIHELYFWDIPKKIIIGKYDTAISTVSHLSDYLGRQPKLPDWVYDGMCLAIQGRGGKERVRERLKKAIDSGVKVNAIWSQDWQGVKITKFGTQLFWDWKWNGTGREIRFPEFPEFVKEMSEKGIRYLGYINCFLYIEGDLYKEAHEKGYCVKNQQGEDYMIYVTTFPAALVDLTNPDAYKWIKEVIKNNMIGEAGLSGWMADYGEYLPTDAVLHSDIGAEEYHNLYPVIWQKVNMEAISEAGKQGEIVFFSRSGYSGSSRNSMLIWAGDQIVTWSKDDGLPSAIPAALSLGLMGIGYTHSDLGGYTTFAPLFKRSKEIFMRWAEFSAFTLVMRSHEGNQPENNIQFDSDDEILKHLAKMTRIHVHLKPYLKKISQEYIDTGIPPMRPLYIHYEQEPETFDIKYEYLLGRDLLVAPVIEKNKKKWNVYFPDDTWVHIWTETIYKKGWHVVNAELGFPPVFYRKVSAYVELFQDLKKLEER